MTANNFVRNMGLGFNIGNNLDAWGGETAWRNPAIERGFITALKKYGYKTIRLPVTWAQNLGPAPDYAIKASWLNRVKEIVDWCVEEGLYIIINIHHDGHGGPRAWIQNTKNPESAAAQLAKVWTQIAGCFADYSDNLIFEAMNEIGFDKIWNRNGIQIGQSAKKAKAYGILNTLNQTFVDTIRASGGKNPQRYLLIPGYWTDIKNTCDPLYIMPKDKADDKLILSVHYYTPWNFAGKRVFRPGSLTWGTQADHDQLNSLFNMMKENFIDKGIPVIMGEYNVLKNRPLQSRINWLLAVTQKSLELGMCPIIWDNGYSEMRNCFHNMGEIRRRSPYTMSDALTQVWQALGGHGARHALFFPFIA